MKTEGQQIIENSKDGHTTGTVWTWTTTSEAKSKDWIRLKDDGIERVIMSEMGYQSLKKILFAKFFNI